ncbi:EamA family transporter [Nocardiopsis sp. N85]|uniref:DMT family transporter n=1 Tax=Nocardiopsis sp. N85 TaxID=3029400 RepID=UPI00237F2219|nr:EamA family transporter [Nocardiopsis sp. N85]MDE3724096.1 EamA family transporter [Nocardiopsis sp. N85]
MPALAFVALCVAWGGTWVAIRLGVTEAPPLWLAASRFIVAGVIILVIARFLGGLRWVERRDWGRLVLMSLGAISVCFGLIFWGGQYVDAGLTAIIVQGFVPIGLFFFGVLLARERVLTRQYVGLGLGLAGVCLLLVSQATVSAEPRGLLGMVMIIVGTLVYDWAAVYGKPIFERYPAAFVSGMENLIGGLLLLPFSLLFEFGELRSGGWMLSGTALGSWLYLVFVGSVVGFTAYTYLLGTWGASRTSAYAFATPVIAVAAGWWLAGERLTWDQGVAIVIIFCAVAFVTVRDPGASKGTKGSAADPAAERSRG